MCSSDLNYAVIKHPHCYGLVDKVKMPTKSIQPRQIVIKWPVISVIYFLLILVAKNELYSYFLISDKTSAYIKHNHMISW